MGEPLVFDELAKEDVAPDGTQTEGDRIKNQPEDEVFCCYFKPPSNLAYHRFSAKISLFVMFLSNI